MSGALFVLAEDNSTEPSAGVTIEDSNIIIEVDYHEFDDEDQENVSVNTEEFTVKNDNDFPVIVTLSAKNLPDDYFVEDKSEEIEANSTKKVSLQLHVPQEEDSGIKEIGQTVILGQGDEELDFVPLKQDTLSMLVIDNFEVEYHSLEGGTEKDSCDTEETDCSLEEDVRVGDNVTFTFDIENLFDDKYDDQYSEIEDIELNIDVDDNDLFADDFEDKYELDDLDAEEKLEDFKVTFTVAEDAPAGDYTFEIELEGEDGKNNVHQVTKELSLEVSREDDDIRITKTELTPIEPTLCTERLYLELEISNLGTDDQKYAAVSVYSEELDIDENVADIELDEFDDDDYTWSKSLELVVPEDVEEGVNYLEIRTYINNDEINDLHTAILDFAECETEEPLEEEEEETDEIEEEEQPEEDEEKDIVGDVNESAENEEENQTGKISSSNIIETIEDSYSRDQFMVGVLAVGIVIVFLMIVTFLIILLR